MLHKLHNCQGKTSKFAKTIVLIKILGLTSERILCGPYQIIKAIKYTRAQ